MPTQEQKEAAGLVTVLIEKAKQLSELAEETQRAILNTESKSQDSTSSKRKRPPAT